MVSFDRMFFGLLSAVLGLFAFAPMVFKWIVERLPIFANSHTLKNEIACAPNVFAALLAPNSKPYSTAPPGVAFA